MFVCESLVVVVSAGLVHGLVHWLDRIVNYLHASLIVLRKILTPVHSVSFIVVPIVGEWHEKTLLLVIVVEILLRVARLFAENKGADCQ